MTNILLVYADDMRSDFFRFMPRIRGMAGRTFANAKTNVALCGAYRTGLYTGRLVKDHGNYGNTVPPPGIDLANLLGKWMDDAGYRTGHFGKWFNYEVETTGIPTGWDTWRQVFDYLTTGFEVYDGTSTTTPAGTVDDYLGAQVATFVAGTEPWFAVLATPQPHYPFGPKAPADMFRHSRYPGPTIVDTVTGKPSWITAQTALTAAEKTVHAAYARAQARELAGLDRALHTLIDGLDLTDTVVIFTSDNGMHYGEHRIPTAGIVKNDLYDSVLRVPLKAMGSGFTHGTTTPLVYADVDVTATVVAIGGATAGLADQAGVDLRDVQDTPGDYITRALLHERSGGGDLNPNPNDGVGMSTATRKLMRWTGETGTDEYEMYDLDTDPDELTNVANDAGRLTERNSLETQMDALLV